MRTNIFIALSFLTCVCLQAQEVLIKGKITNKDHIENIHILNTTSRFNSITDQDGNFAIEAKFRDTLVFSGITYYPKKVVVNEEIFYKKYVEVTLVNLINELDEVFLGNRLTGDLARDIKGVKTHKQFNFDDVGIEGFKGEPEEKIPTLIGQTIGITSVNIEALYKYISGYYANLRKMRKWNAQDLTIAKILNTYTNQFFIEAYQIPEQRVYDFVLYCVESSNITTNFKQQNYNLVLQTFKEKSIVYLQQMQDEVAVPKKE